MQCNGMVFSLSKLVGALTLFDIVRYVHKSRTICYWQLDFLYCLLQDYVLLKLIRDINLKQ
jgi:hypothetical protein